MLKIAICDDNYAICAEIEKLILEYSKSSFVEISIEVFGSGESLINFIQKEHRFDLIFLDIELGTTTGVAVGNKIRNEFDDYVSKIVFISSKTGYEQQLFDVQPLNFLKKPIDSEKIIKCINLAVKILDIDNKTFKYQAGNDFNQVKLKEIIYFESKLRKIKIVTINGEDIFYGSLEKIKEQLPKTFVTSHGSYIVNYNHIKQISGELISMENGHIIPISKRNIKNIHTLQIQLIKELRDVNI